MPALDTPMTIEDVQASANPMRAQSLPGQTEVVISGYGVRCTVRRELAEDATRHVCAQHNVLIIWQPYVGV